MPRQSVTRDGNMFVQYGRGHEMPEQHGGEEEWMDDIKMRRRARVEESTAEELQKIPLKHGNRIATARERAIERAKAESDAEKQAKPRAMMEDPDRGKTKEQIRGENEARAREERAKDTPPGTSDPSDESGASDEQIRDGTQRLSSDIEQLRGASSLDRIRILEAIQMDPNLQALVQAGLMNWNDIMSKNTGKVVAPDGSVPETVVDEDKLKALQSRLLKVGLQQRQTEQVLMRQSVKQRTTPGPKAGSGLYRNRRVYMDPRYLPGQLPDLKNKVLV